MMEESQTTSRRPRRNRRLRLACSRCQKRKIRCDGQYPTCNNCRKASVVCADGDSLRLSGVSRDEDDIVGLKERIVYLESLLRERFPEVDVSGDVIEAPLLGITPAAGVETLPSSGPTVPDGPGPWPSGSGNALSHEIGLVSVGSSSAPRYIGPSSGYFLSRMLHCPVSSSAVNGEGIDSHGRRLESSRNRSSASRHILPLALFDPSQSRVPLPNLVQARQLCDAFFDTISPQYPILHRPSFMQMLETLCAQGTSVEASDDMAFFQVNMVLAIGATILSHRMKLSLPAESYFSSAMDRFASLALENSLPGLQCLLLLLVFTIHNPHVRLNVWYLNYQCIATMLDLGLQRNITTQSGITLLEQEMRTRLFWVVFAMDRTIATIMGRPIGLRDEGCELRLPQLLDDETLLDAAPAVAAGATSDEQPVMYMSFAIHLFRLAKLNSEIKYVAQSIVRGTPRYAYPPVADIQQWQRDMVGQLDKWAEDIPNGGDNRYMANVCQLRYLSLLMLLLRPSPAIPSPSVESLSRCYESCRRCIHLFNQMYRNDMLVYSWIAFHSILLSTVTLLYCIRAVSSIAHGVEPDVLVTEVGISLSILSAAGEHWPGAKRSRDVLEDLMRDVVRWVKELPKKSQPEAQGETIGLAAVRGVVGQSTTGDPSIGEMPSLDSDFSYINQQVEAGGFSLEDWWTSVLPGESTIVDPANIDAVMHNFFTDFTPTGDIMY